MYAILIRYLKDFGALILPDFCIHCDQKLLFHEQILCAICAIDLPYTDFFTFSANKTAKTFWGRLPFEKASSVFYFKKGGIIQKLMFGLKYQNRPEIGVFLGQLMAKKALEHDFLDGITALVGIPSFILKQKSRGYNQCDEIIKGIVSLYPIVDLSSYVLKNRATESQTKKHRYERFENLKNAFELLELTVFDKQHILMIDDIITTGATMEALAAVLYENVPQLKISFLSAAISMD